MIDCSQASRPILVAASSVLDAGLARSVIEELGRVPVLVQDVGDAMRHIGGSGRVYGAMLVGERVGEVSGFTLCAVARDAGHRLPLVLVTSDVCRWTAVRAARLQVNILWHPVPARRIARTLRAQLPRTPCENSSHARGWQDRPADGPLATHPEPLVARRPWPGLACSSCNPRQLVIGMAASYI